MLKERVDLNIYLLAEVFDDLAVVVIGFNVSLLGGAFVVLDVALVDVGVVALIVVVVVVVAVTFVVSIGIVVLLTGTVVEVGSET